MLVASSATAKAWLIPASRNLIAMENRHRGGKRLFKVRPDASLADKAESFFGKLSPPVLALAQVHGMAGQMFIVRKEDAMTPLGIGISVAAVLGKNRKTICQVVADPDLLKDFGRVKVDIQHQLGSCKICVSFGAIFVEQCDGV